MLAADGVANRGIAANLSVTPTTARAWRARFEAEGLAKLGNMRTGRGPKPVIAQSKIDEIVDLTRNSKPAGQTYWSVRN